MQGDRLIAKPPVKQMARYNSILLVDDDPTQIAILTAYFASQGVTGIKSAGDAARALTILAEEQAAFDLVVTDLQMPNMDGLEFLRHLKEQNFTGSLAIISSVQENLLEHAGRLAKLHGLELLGQIHKPFTKQTLDEVLFSTPVIAESRVAQPEFETTPEIFEQAILDREFVPFYQPKIDMKTGRITGGEALARWFRVTGERVYPDVFIRFAEKNDLIKPLTFCLFDQVLDDMRTFMAIDPDLQIAVNLATDLMMDISLPSELRDKVHQAGLRPDNISFEITENSVIDLDPTTLEVLSRLRVADFEVAIDDFGTGSSNIQVLRDFPYSDLKIDKSFISDALENSFSRQTVLAAVALAHDQKMRIVAEGIEDRKTWDFVRDVGIEYGQGYFMAKPMSADDFREFVRSNPNGLEWLAEQSAA